MGILKYLPLYLKNWPKKLIFPYGILSFISFLIFFNLIKRHVFMIPLIFTQMTDYLKLRFVSINNSLKMCQNRGNTSNVVKLIGSHQKVCRTTEELNSFWSPILLLDMIFYSIVFLVYNYVNIKSDEKLSAIISTLFSIMILIYYFISFMPSALVNQKVNFYRLFSFGLLLTFDFT